MTDKGEFVGGASPNQSAEAQATVRMGMKLFGKYKKHRAKYDKYWLHYYKMFRGDQWDNIRMPRHRQREIINMIWQAVQSNLPLQTDARPTLSFIPTEPSDTPFADVLNMVSQSDWETKNWLAVLTEVILDGYIYGIGYSSLTYDDDADYGLGSAEYASEDPFYLYPDPDATDVNSKESFGFISAKPVCTSRLKIQYPELADEIKSDISDVIASSKTSLNDFKINRQSTDREMPDLSFMDGTDGDSSIEKTLLIKIFLKPEEVEEIEEEYEDDSGEIQKSYVLKKKYPFGRVITIASGMLLDDEDSLPYVHGNFPYSRYLNYILPREFFGVSEVEQLESPQRLFNKILNGQLEILNLTGNPAWVVSTDSGVDPNKLINRTGLVIEKEPNSEVFRQPGIEMSPTALRLAEMTEQWFNNMSGSTDVSRGQTPGSVTAASAIEQLTEAARTRIRQKQRNLDDYLRDVGQQYADVVLEKYDKSRVFRVTNDQDSTQYFRFRTEVRELPDDEGNPQQQLVAVVQNLEGDDTEPKEFLISGRFDVKINTASSLPFTVADRETKVLNLFDRGIVDEAEVLETLDYPNREKVLERLEQRKQAMAEQEAAAQGGV